MGQIAPLGEKAVANNLGVGGVLVVRFKAVHYQAEGLVFLRGFVPADVGLEALFLVVDLEVL